MLNNSVFAINFGTSRSWAAVVHDGMEVIEPSARGIPSYVEFGNMAPRLCEKFAESVNAANSIYGVKRLLGRKFDDAVVQEAAKYSPMDIVRGEEGRPAVLVEYYGESRTVLLEEVVAMIMVELKERMEKVVGHRMADVVLTVPHCFGDSQRRALKDAAKIAGLNVLRLLDETTAAAITYSQRCEPDDREHVLVVDVGGGSTNAAVVSVTASSVNVKSTAGSCCLGAEEFDRTLMDYCLDELAQNNGVDVGKLGVRCRKRLQRQLKVQCVEARQTLYSSTMARIKLDINGDEVQLDVSREAFDAFNEANFDRIRLLIKAAIDDAPSDLTHINAVYLIGGGSRVTALEKTIAALLPGTRLIKTFYRDEAVIKGAAIFASHLGSDGAGFKVTNIVGRSVLLETTKLQEIYAPNAPVPGDLSLSVDRNGATMNLKMSEYTNGSSHPVGTFVIGDVAAKKVTKGKVNCTFRIDENGLLSMSATQETALSQESFSKASFRVQLPSTTRRFLSQSIAICESDGTTVPIIDATRYDIALPVIDGKTFLQRDGSQREMQFSLYHGNSQSAKRCTLVGTLSVALPNAQHDSPAVELTASVDRSFLLTATATCIMPAQVERLIVVPHQWTLPYGITSKLAKGLSSKRAASDAKNALQLFCYELGMKIEEQQNAGLRSATFNSLVRKRADVLDKLAQDGLLASEVYAKCKQELEVLCSVTGINEAHSNGGGAEGVGNPQPTGAGSASGAVTRSSTQKTTGGIFGSIVSRLLP